MSATAVAAPPGRRPLAFLDDAVVRHGARRHGEDDVVMLPCSQAALAAEAQRSAGTVAYYMAKLTGIVRREPGGLVVDLAALGAARERRFCARRPGAPPPPLREASDDAKVSFGRALLRVVQELEALLLTFLQGPSDDAGLAGRDRTDPRTFPANFGEKFADFAALAARGSLPFPKEPGRQLSSFLGREPRREKFADESSRICSIGDRSERLCDDDGVSRAVAPLVSLCERLRLPASIDDDGRRWLSLYTPDELAWGAEQVMRQLRGDQAGISRPLGLLVAKAQRGDEGFFLRPPPPPPPPPPPEDEDEDEEAGLAVADLDDEALDALDDDIRASLRRPRLIRAAEADPGGWDSLRRRAWRARQRTGAGR